MSIGRDRIRSSTLMFRNICPHAVSKPVEDKSGPTSGDSASAAVGISDVGVFSVFDGTGEVAIVGANVRIQFSRCGCYRIGFMYRADLKV